MALPVHRILRAGFSIFVFLECLLLFCEATSSNVCTALDPDCNGNFLDCSRSIPCFHGVCDTGGSCFCQSCWRGENCNDYVDRYPPRFLIKSKYIALKSQTGLLFVEEAVDADGGMTCLYDDSACPCASIRYSIHSGNGQDLFMINSMTGQVYVTAGASLTFGAEYELIIRATSFKVDYNASGSNQRSFDEMKVTLFVDTGIAGNSTEQLFLNDATMDDGGQRMKWQESPLDNDVLQADTSDEHQRFKRDAAILGSELTIMTLTQLEPAADTVLVGDQGSYRLDILLPQISGMNLIVELFTNDPETKASVFRICKSTILSVGSSVTSDQGPILNIQPTLKQNAQQNWNDRVIYDFGKVSNTEPTINASRIISITFSAVLTTIATGGSTYISVGAEYDSENYVWVGQSKLTTSPPTTDPSTTTFATAFVMEGPDSIAEDQAGIFLINASSTYPNETMFLDIFSPTDDIIDLYSVGNMRLKSVGDNYPCLPADLMIYSTTYYDTETLKSKYRGVLDLGSVINCGSDRGNPNTAAQLMQFEFAVYVLNGAYNTLSGNNLSMAAGLVIGNKTIWTGLINVTVNARVSGLAKGSDPTVQLLFPTGSITMPEKGVQVIQYNVTFTDTAYTNTQLKIVIPDASGMSICSARLYYRGFNIPYVPKFVYTFTSGSEPNTSIQALVNLGRIQTTGQLPLNGTANSLTIEVGVRSVKAVSNQKVTLSVGTKSADSPQITTTTPAPFDPNLGMKLIDAIGSSDLYENSETAVNIQFLVPEQSPYEPFELEVMGQFGDGTAAARVCRVEIISVGRRLPCVDKDTLNAAVDYTTTTDTRVINDRAIIPFDRLCAATEVMTNSTPSDTDRTMIVSFVAEVPKQDQLIAPGSYWLNAGMKLGDLNVLAGSVKYNLIAPSLGNYLTGVLPLFDVTVQSGNGASKDGSNYVLFRIKLPPQSRANYKLSVTTTAGASVCRLKIIHLGYNMPCVDARFFRNNNNSLLTTTVQYTPDGDDNTQYTQAVLDMGSVTNIGQNPLVTSSRNDRNTILIGAAIHITNDGPASYDINYAFTYATSETNTGKVTMNVAKTAPTAGTLGSVTMGTSDNDTNIHNGATKVVYADFQFPSGTIGGFTVTFTKISTTPSTNELDFCSGSLTFVGNNMPCLDVEKVNTVLTPSTLVLTVAKTCHSGTFSDAESSRIRAELAFNAADNTDATIGVAVAVNGGTPQSAQLALTQSGAPPPPTKYNKFTSNAISFPTTDLTIPVGQKQWVPIRIRIPVNATLNMNITAEGAYANGRAIITVYDVLVGQAGINVACLRNGSLLAPQFSKTPGNVTTQSQNNVITINFGYVTNTGFTDKRGTMRPTDNDVNVEILVRMTDHPNVENNAVFPLTITVQADDVQVSSVLNLTASRTGNEVESLNFQLILFDQTKVFAPKDNISINVLISHQQNSTLEPTTVMIRFYSPSFVDYVAHYSNGSNVTKGNAAYVDLMFGPFLFDDNLSIDLNHNVDPNGTRLAGTPQSKATITGRGICQVQTRAGANYPTDFHYCTPNNIMQVTIGPAAGCSGSLAKLVQPCQLTASSAMDDTATPDKAFGTGSSFWVPAFRLGYFIKTDHYFQVDFGNITKVNSIIINKPPDTYNPITTFNLLTSTNARSWKQVLNQSPTSFDATGKHTEIISGDVRARYYRIAVVAPVYEAKTDKSVAAAFDFDGCAITKNVPASDICTKTASPQTLVSSNLTQYRHFAVDTNAVMLYFCDVVPKKVGLTCSACAGDCTKNIIKLPPSIGSILGFNKVKNFIVGVDPKGRSRMKTTNGKNWSPTVPADYAAGDMTLANSVPAKQGTWVVTQGDWGAKFGGLHYKGAGTPQIKW